MKHAFREAVHALALAAGALLLAVTLAAAAPASAQDAGGAPDSAATTPTAAVITALDDSAEVAIPDSTAAVASAPAPRVDPNGRPLVGSRLVRLTGKPENVVRSGPGNNFAILGTYPTGTRFPVIARSGAWYGVRVSDTGTGWVHASLCKEMDDLSGLEWRPNPKLYTRTGSYVLSGYGGAYAYDRKSNSAVLGGRLGYYVFDRIVAEAGVSWTHVRRPAEIVESLFDLRLEAESFPMLFYQMNLTWEVLPGRQMVPYVTAGVGSTLMLGRSQPSTNFGAGTRLFLNKRAAMRWEVRDYRFHNPSSTASGLNNNVEFTLGSEVLF
jgi:outer membrane beta-barrel protein